MGEWIENVGKVRNLGERRDRGVKEDERKLDEGSERRRRRKLRLCDGQGLAHGWNRWQYNISYQ
ncbi:unnamed protein product [Sphenostylis stenocarpa]|uniref:Uncharacterized protein n=1 Tax=Sphenostylis stenocarpa TaxID=92480 RepID=A0AA86VYM1_9FABA|nr:unnamed protein product [Sphenostylis stenocarpa]